MSNKINFYVYKYFIHQLANHSTTYQKCPFYLLHFLSAETHPTVHSGNLQNHLEHWCQPTQVLSAKSNYPHCQTFQFCQKRCQTCRRCQSLAEVVARSPCHRCLCFDGDWPFLVPCCQCQIYRDIRGSLCQILILLLHLGCPIKRKLIFKSLLCSSSQSYHQLVMVTLRSRSFSVIEGIVQSGKVYLVWMIIIWSNIAIIFCLYCIVRRKVSLIPVAHQDAKFWHGPRVS